MLAARCRTRCVGLVGQDGRTSNWGKALLLGSLLWLGSYYLLANHLGRYLPLLLKKWLLMLDPEGGGLQSWSSAVWLSTGLPVALLARKYLRSDGQNVGLQRPAARMLATGALLAPIALVLSSYIAWKLALPTILEELAAGGSRAVHKNSGAFGRSLKKTPAAMVLFWGVVLSPLAEELLFRGGLWSGIRNLWRPRETPQSPSSVQLVFTPSITTKVASALAGWFRSGGFATLLTASLFAYLHWDMPGGVGIIRLSQAFFLGLFLGELRHRSGAVWPCVVMHAIFNALTLSKLRKWWLSTGWPSPLPIPLHWWQLAFACFLLLVALGWFSIRKHRRQPEPAADSSPDL